MIGTVTLTGCLVGGRYAKDYWRMRQLLRRQEISPVNLTDGHRSYDRSSV